jgi:hypothetical protein
VVAPLDALGLRGGRIHVPEWRCRTSQRPALRPGRVALVGRIPLLARSGGPGCGAARIARAGPDGRGRGRRRHPGPGPEDRPQSHGAGRGHDRCAPLRGVLHGGEAPAGDRILRFWRLRMRGITPRLIEYK